MIYAIRAGEAIKFGVAKNPAQRLKELQTGCPHKLELVAVMDLPHENERLMHEYLSEHRLVGEWFAPGDKVSEVLSDPRWRAKWQHGGSAAPAVSVAAVERNTVSDKPDVVAGKFDRTAYQREYMRKRRAK